MTVHYDGQTSDSETRFREIYSNEPRLTTGSYESVGIRKTQEDDNEGWNIVKRKAKRVTFTKHAKSLTGPESRCEMR
jgi:hypothetical protein